MTQAFGTTQLHGLPDAGQPEGLAGMDRGMEILALHVIERFQMSSGRMTRLGTGDVETHDSAITPTNGQIGDLETSSSRAHRRTDGVNGEIGSLGTLGEAIHDGLHHLVEGEAFLGAQLGRHAHLGVHHSVGRQVARAFERHSLDRVLVLHDTHRVSERFEVQHEIVAFGATMEPLRQIGHVGGRKPRVSVFGGQFDHGFGTQSTIEVIVKKNFGCAQVGVVHRAPAMSESRRNGSSGERCNQFHVG